MASQFQLIMRSGPTPGASFTLEGDQMDVGRDSTNEIVINDAEISRRHARLTFQGGKYVLEDLGSEWDLCQWTAPGGTSVLKSGEVVSFGEQIVMIFEATHFDAGATVVSPAPQLVPAAATCHASTPSTCRICGQRTSQSRPVPIPGTVNIRRSNPVLIVVAVGVFLFRMCVAFFWWVDSNFLWCTFFPFLGGC